MLITGLYLGTLIALATFLITHYGRLVGGGIFYAIRGGLTPGAMLILLASFLPAAMGAMIAARLLHDRRAGTLIGRTGPVIRDALRAGLPLMGFSLLFFPFSLGSDGVMPHLPAAEALILAPATLLALFIQTGTEELVFRGYLLQQLAARFRTPLAWMVAPSLLFSALHYDPATFGPNTGWVVAWAALFGMLCADLTARAGNLGPALAFHFINNFWPFCMMGTAGHMDGLALWVAPFALADGNGLQLYFLIDLVSLVVMWLLARIALRL